MKQQDTGANTQETQDEHAAAQVTREATASVTMPGNGTLATTVETTSEERKVPNKWAVLAILAIGIFMATLDSSIVNISLPTIARYFGVPLSGAIEWVGDRLPGRDRGGTVDDGTAGC